MSHWIKDGKASSRTEHQRQHPELLNFRRIENKYLKKIPVFKVFGLKFLNMSN